ncbi:MAG: hypothetical protein KBE23_22865 [Chloroflexi bacterium]|nr:hypothetical protein [Chloroflexota bacterium]MBP7045612.1 hypothetical protein [Chloroflexota bacterium]
MKTIILLNETPAFMPEHFSSRARPLWNLAGKTIIGHLLDLLQDTLVGDVIFVIDPAASAVEAWIGDNYPHLAAHFVAQPSGAGQVQALALCRDYLDEGAVLVVADLVLAEAAFTQLAQMGADVVRVTPPDTAVSPSPSAAVIWFKNGRFLHHALQSVNPAATLQDVYQVLPARGTAVATLAAQLWLETHTTEALLYANQRLLGLGYGTTPDAIERSYAEDFTVLPPVYIDEEAYVETAVIGPYVSIHAGAVVKDAIVRHSIIAADAHVETCILDGALVGERAKMIGSARKLVAGDDSITDLTKDT